MPDDKVPPARLAPLTAAELYTSCGTDVFEFTTTAELAELEVGVGHERALGALDFGVRVRERGYNLFVLGQAGSQRHRIVEEFLAAREPQPEPPSDWCYVNNFDDERKPIAIRLPAGRGTELRRDAAQLIEELRGAIPAAFDSEQHRSGLADINQEFEERVRGAFEQLQAQAKEMDMSLVSTPHGFAIAPLRRGEILSDEEFERLPAEEKKKKTEAMEAMSAKLREHIEQLPLWHKERRDKLKALHRELIVRAAGQLIDQVKARYADIPQVAAHFDALRENVIENAKDFQTDEESAPRLPGFSPQASLSRYTVNLLVGHAGAEKPPIVYESNPSVQNLLGRVEHVAQFGALVTNFTMILPGALHKANGGYLILDAERVLMEPFAWSALKRALAAREVEIESLGQLLSLVSTVSLEPQAIPLDLKVILIGERLIHYLLSEHDPEFGELFKVAADFENRIDRSEENVRRYANLLGNVARREGLLPLTRGAVARTIEHSARLLGDAQMLTTRLRDVADVVREANFWAREGNQQAIDTAHVQKAIDSQTHRLDRVRAEIQREIQRSNVLIDTDGAKVAQVNGLSMLGIGSFRFGQPARITASARVGDGTIVDIERETELGGPIHSKGVLILSSYLRSKYAADAPLSISASLVFEQSYGGVEGDSASVAETCALLSAIAGLPIKQSLAVTGSVNQHGQVQVIGGVNEKIEGFFDTCKARGLTGTQGVMIPKDNVQHLMLRADVVRAAEAEQFSVYPIATIDEAITLLTGVPAGERDAAGKFPLGSVNYLVEERLKQLAELRREYDTGRGKGRKGRKAKAKPAPRPPRGTRA
jgi:lon-related putative ATP-dependent protease